MMSVEEPMARFSVRTEGDYTYVNMPFIIGF